MLMAPWSIKHAAFHRRTTWEDSVSVENPRKQRNQRGVKRRGFLDKAVREQVLPNARPCTGKIFRANFKPAASERVTRHSPTPPGHGKINQPLISASCGDQLLSSLT